MSLPLRRNVQMQAGLALRRKVIELFLIFTSTPLIGTLKTHFELKPTLKAFNKSMGLA